MKIITVATQKGGVGKTTSTLNIGVGLAARNKKVLLIDMDPQRNLSTIYSDYSNEDEYTMVDVYNPSKNVTLDDIIVKINEYLYIAKSSVLLGGTEKGNQSGDEWILSENIENMKNQFDYILIDTPPLNGFLTTSALLAATDIIIPIEADLFSYQGAGDFLTSVEKIKKRNNPNLNVLGLIITRFKKQTNSGRQMAGAYQNLCIEQGTKILGIVPDSVGVKDAQLALKDVFSYDEKCNGAQAYKQIVNKILKES